MSKNKRKSSEKVSRNTDLTKKSSLATLHRKVLIRIGTFISLLLFVTIGFGAFTQWQYTTIKNLVSEKANSTHASYLPALPLSTPQYEAGKPAKEYIYAGGKLVAVSEPNIPTDLAVWRPSNGVWYVMAPGGGLQAAFQWGMEGDEPVAGDYDGDGKTDFSVFRPDDTNNTGTWYIFNSSTNSISGVGFGKDTDTPAMADYDGDGKTDIAVVRENATPGYTTWYILRSSDAGLTIIEFGADTDLPAPADYDGDGKADIAVWRDSNDTFYFLKSSDNTDHAVAFTPPAIELTAPTQKPVSADYDGDGRADFAVRDGTKWVILKSSTGTAETITWGNAADIAVHNDYDGDGKVDLAVWRESEGNWYIRQSGSNGALRTTQWGQAGDTPVPVFYRR